MIERVLAYIGAGTVACGIWFVAMIVCKALSGDDYDDGDH